MDRFEKLRILAEGAKYDASCSTSGVERKNVGRMGNTSCAGICHSWSADGRCISLLKVLLTNRCAYDCAYCVNRRTADTERASFEPEELADLTIEFYRRNYIEGLFLSAAVEGSPDRTSERMLRCLELLRHVHGFAGYIHAKIIPGTSDRLIHRIGLVADRISVNVELPSRESLAALAPQKRPEGIFLPMGQIRDTLADRKSLRGPMDGRKPPGDRDLERSLPSTGTGAAGVPAVRKKEVFTPAGQTTQMIIGASRETDRQIVKLSEGLYQKYRIKRVYFSAYIPVADSPLLPSRLAEPPLLREHRLYQADWLLRFYGFTADEILEETNPNLDPLLDPKVAWAVRHPEFFPMEINKASLEELLRIPGIGAISARRILRQRRFAAVRFDDLQRIGVVVKRARHFITCCGRYQGAGVQEPEALRHLLAQGGMSRAGGTFGAGGISGTFGAGGVEGKRISQIGDPVQLTMVQALAQGGGGW